MPRVVIRSWTPGLRKVSLVHLLQENAGLSLTAAKKKVDDLLLGEIITIEVESESQALRLRSEIRSLGGICEVREDNRGD